MNLHLTRIKPMEWILSSIRWIILIIIINFMNMMLVYASTTTGPGSIGTTDGTSNLEIWLRSDIGVSYSGTVLTSWENQSGYTGRNADTIGGSPDYLVNQINGLTMISFDGVNDYLFGNTPSLDFSDSNLSIIMVSAIHQIPSDDYYGIFSMSDSGGIDYSNTNGFALTLVPTAPLYCQWNQNIGITPMCALNEVGYTGFQIYYLERENDTASITINAITTTSATYSYTSTISPDKYILSARWINGSIYSANRGENDYAEIIIYNGALPDVQKTIIHNYLSAKYNIFISTKDHYAGDEASNGDFDKDVAGIGKSGGISYTQANSGGLIIDGSQYLVDNGDFVMAGHNESYNYFVYDDITGDIER